MPATAATTCGRATDGQPREPRTASQPARDRLIHRDNTYGTPEEDAFRRDFTVNALFYDIGTFAIIDYVGGLEDLEGGSFAASADPDDPLRRGSSSDVACVVLASARLDFTIDESIVDAMGSPSARDRTSAPPRLLEEFYKILRSGHAEELSCGCSDRVDYRTITPEVIAAVRASVAIDRRARLVIVAAPMSSPESLTNRDSAGHAAGADRVDTAVIASCRSAPNAKASRSAPCQSPERRRAAASSSVATSRASRHHRLAARSARAASPPQFRRSVHLARDPRRQARSRGPLARAQGAGCVAPATTARCSNGCPGRNAVQSPAATTPAPPRQLRREVVIGSPAEAGHDVWHNGRYGCGTNR